MIKPSCVYPESFTFVPQFIDFIQNLEEKDFQVPRVTIIKFLRFDYFLEDEFFRWIFSVSQIFD